MFPDENTQQSRNRRKLQHKKSIYEKFTPNIILTVKNCFFLLRFMQILKGFRMTAIFLAAGKVCMGCTLKPHCGSGVFQVPASPWLVIRHGHSKVSYILEARPGFWHDILNAQYDAQVHQKILHGLWQGKDALSYYFYST